MDEGRRNPSEMVVVVGFDQLVQPPANLFEAFWTAASASWSGALAALVRHAGDAGKLRARLTETACQAPARLAYCEDIIEAVQSWRASGGRTALTGPHDGKTISGIAAHLGLFDDAHGGIGLAGESDAALQHRYGTGGYAMIAPGGSDIPSMDTSRSASRSTSRSARVALSFGAVLRLLRPHQWLKNALVFVPMLAAHQLTPGPLWQAVLAFIAFSLIASGTYVLNDLMDLNADRAHPRKRNRPLASGAVSVAQGTLLMPLLVLAGIGTALLSGPALLGTLLLYTAVTSAYSFKLKRLVVIDICTLAVLYTLRILAGSAATGVPSSMWLLAFSTFFFFSLAAVKRQAELVDGIAAGKVKAHGRGYHVDDLGIVSNIAVSAGMVSVLVLALYANSDPVQMLYRTPEMLWGVCLVLLFWNSRIAILTQRGQMHDDPLVFAARDRVSLACGAIVGALALAGAIV
ncbi:UbiA family prenyltransferase [Erythrobacter sanguineus]|uniref:4-hydroxybenzoate polyprenyltransferase n=1 Tax=Erythrobacter sanguineus TaxID=198312 RepID=A0A1M7RUC7_9SPHN|nr:UbiA family prenyltransferase [Erythrobacter sanguineus]SHN49863.1 4-hydroxybenzoate polyprenyltransferase [Erythrobacter sanguineus]